MSSAGRVSGQGATVAFVSNFSETLVSFRGPLLRAMVERGHRVHVCAPEVSAEVAQGLAGLGVKHERIAFHRTGINPIEDVGTFRALARIYRRVRPDVVLAASSKPVIYGSLAARRVGVPACYSIITGLGYAFIGADWKARLVGVATRQLYRLSFVGNRRVFFQNSDNLAMFEKWRLLRSPEQAVLINGSGVDLERFAPEPLPERVSFLLIARLLRDKGVCEYVEAARIVKARHPEVRFQLVGWIDSNPTAISEDELRSWVEEGVVTYLGRLDDVRPVIAETTVYVLPSYQEGAPRTVLEAMAMGRPIITTDVPGCRQTVEHGRNGYLVPARDARALAQAMERFVGEPERAEAMGRESRRIAEAKYDVHEVNRVMLEAMEL